MEQILDFFRRLTDTSDWPPRWYCGNWSDFHGWLYIISDITIWAAYMAIPLVLIRYVILKQGVPLKGVFFLFGAFILLCGFTHLLDAAMFWIPAYRINALVRFFTAVVSVATVIALIKLFDQALGLRTSQEFSQELAHRQQAVRELERSNSELQQFAYVASHDLQSPLRTIENYLTLLEAKHGEKLDDARRIIGVSTAATGRMRALINDLLSFSQVGSDGTFEAVNLNNVVADVLVEQQADIQQTGAVVDVGPLPTLQAHSTDMKQIFANLISNALKYRRPDVAPHVAVRAKLVGDTYQFTVQDNGIGIDPQHHDRVFQLFQRLHGRGGNNPSGTGIGLATCKKVVELYGGRIWIDAAAETSNSSGSNGAGGTQGSTFHFTLPKNPKTIQQYDPAHSLHSVS